MTAHAREALADCETALADYEASANTPFPRTRWVAVMTLLRTVGYVLREVDRPAATTEVRRRIDEAWERIKASKPDPRIFHDFIDADRHQAVHLYEIRASINVTIQLGGVSTNLQTGESGSTPSGPAVYDFVMREGPFQGRDPRELCREAITFWREYLDDIDGRP